MRLASTAPAAALLSAALALAVAVPLGAQREVAETIDVREAALVVELPAGVGPEGAAPALEVSERGVARPVTKVESLADEWRVRIEVDPEHCDPVAKRAALLALAARAAELTGLGPVEVAVSGRPTEVRLAASREPGAVERVLLELAGAGPCGDRGTDRIAAAAARLAAGVPAPSVRAELWPALAADRLAASDARKLLPCPTGACLLLWVGVSAGARLDLAAPTALRGAESQVAVAAIERDRGELAEALGVQGWQVVALAGFAPAPPAVEGEARAGAGGAPGAARVMPSQPWLEKPSGPGPEAYARYLDLQTAALRQLAARTAGALVEDAEALAARLGAARRFVRVWIRTDSPRDGEAHEVAVRWVGRGRNRALEASTWLVTGESPALAAARARAGR
jgi:hypothetical protein